MGRQKPKTNRTGSIYEPKGYDLCQTPAYAVEPLIPYLTPFKNIWEPAAGKGYLADAVIHNLPTSWVISTDIQTGQNYFEYEPPLLWEVSVTNPPYSIKYKWLRRSYELGKPFALLMPVEMLGAKTAQKMFREYGIQVLFLNGRINFEMPNKGFEGSSAQFPVAWFCWQLNLEKDMVFSI